MNIYFVGAPTEAKGIADFNILAQELPQAKFYWFCYKLDASIKKTYTQINFIVGLNDQKLHTMIKKKMDLFISCSHFEGFCLPIAEALLLEKPAISYDLEEVRSEFKDTIEYVPVFSIGIYKVQLEKLLKRKKNKNELLIAKEYIQRKFSPSVVKKRFLTTILS